MNPLEHALAYRNLGWSVVPIPNGQKHPVIDWKRFQSAPPERGELTSLITGACGMGVVCGKVSGNLAVLDFDTPGAYDHWRNLCPEWASKLPTDRRGELYHVFACTELPAASTGLFLKGLKGKAGDILGEGKLCVLPPTLHPSGEHRSWVIDPFGKPIPTLELVDLGVVEAARPPTEKPGPLLPGAIPQGSRNETLMRLAASLRGRGIEDKELELLLHSVNRQQCVPPLESREVESILRWMQRLWEKMG